MVVKKESKKKSGASSLGGKDPIPWEIANKMCEITAQHDKRFALLFAVGIYSGLRIGDMKKVTRQNIKDKEFKIIAEKTGKTELRWFPPPFYELLKRCDIAISGKNGLKAGCLFGSTANPEKPLSTQHIGGQLKKYCQMAGVPAKYDIGTHSLRKTFARRLYDKSFDKPEAARKICDLFNHEDERETRKYIGVIKSEIKEMVMNIDNERYDDRSVVFENDPVTIGSIRDIIHEVMSQYNIKADV
jgi:integrase